MGSQSKVDCFRGLRECSPRGIGALGVVTRGGARDRPLLEAPAEAVRGMPSLESSPPSKDGVQSMNLRLSVLSLSLVATVAVASTEADWQAREVRCHGNLPAMLEAIANSPTPLQMRQPRSAAELARVLEESGRFAELGLTLAEGRILVNAAYGRAGLSLEGQTGEDLSDSHLRGASTEAGAAGLSWRPGTEFEPQDAVLMRWPFDWNSQRDEYTDIVTALGAAEVTLYMWVNTATQRDSAIAYMRGRGEGASHVKWVIDRTSTVWIRDYGPNFIYEKGGDRWGIVDFHYYTSRPQDDDTPRVVAGATGVPTVDCQDANRVFTEGGNLNYDGLGTVVYSTRTYGKNNGITDAQVDQRILNAFQATQGIVPQDPSLDGTGHVDMFLKIVNENTVLVGRYASDQRDYQVLEDCATLFENSTNGVGEPWNVVRIVQPDVYYVLFIFPVVRTYTNSVVSNDVVILPTYGISYDDTAIKMHGRLFPGKTIVPVRADTIIESAGAWHCVTMEYASPAN